MTPAELRAAILGHLSAYPSMAFTAYDFRRALKTGSSIMLIRKTADGLVGEGLAVAVVEAMNDGDPRPCTRWKLAGGETP